MKFRILICLWGLMAIALGLAAHARADALDAGLSTAPISTLDAAPIGGYIPPMDASADPVAVPAGIDAMVAMVGDTYQAIRAGRVRAAIALILVLLVAALRRFAGEVLPWLRTDRGGVALVLGCALLLELVAVLQLRAPIDTGMLLTALMSGLTAAGGWVMVRRLLWPPDLAVQS